MKTNKLAASIILLAAGCMFQVSAHAEEIHSKKATTTVETAIKGGELYLTDFTNKVDFSFDLKDAITTDENGNAAINSTIKSKLLPGEAGVIRGQVVDLLGSNEKWTVNVKLSEFVQKEDEDQKLVAPIIQGSKMLGAEKSKAAENLVIDQEGINIVSDGDTTGLGVNTVGLYGAEMSFGYTANKKVTAGEYSGTINWNLVDAETGQS